MEGQNIIIEYRFAGGTGWLAEMAAYRLTEGTYQPTGRLEGSQAVTLAPFPDLALVPASLWP